MRRRRTGTAGGTGLRLLLLMLLLLGLSALSGCGQKSVFSLDPEEISRIAVYTGGVPADAQRKETENAGEVERIVRILNGIRVRRKASYDDVPAGGIGIWFEVLGKDGQTSVARVLGDGDLLAQGAMLYRIAAIDPEEIWESLDAPSETVGETGLPSVEVTDREQDTAVAQYSAADEIMEEEGNGDGTEETAREENTAAADFAVCLLRETLKDDENREGNLLLSPASVLQALGLAANGAGGSTLEQMEEVFGMDLETLNGWLTGEGSRREELTGYSQANALWLNDTGRLQPRREYLDRMQSLFGASVFTLPFDESGREEINRWTEEQTEGMIKEVLEEIPEDTMMYLVNAAAFDARWEEAYGQEQLRAETFTCRGGEEKTVTMMYSTEHRYLTDGVAEGFLKSYEGGAYAFAALLPPEDMDVDTYAAGLTGQGIQKMLQNVQDRQVEAAMPRFSINCDEDLEEALKSMGMSEAFDPVHADFSGIGKAGMGGLSLGSVQHKAFLEVNEKGTRAAAATAAGVMAISAGTEREIKEIRLDRPFVCMIVDMETGCPLFLGVIRDVGEG